MFISCPEEELQQNADPNESPDTIIPTWDNNTTLKHGTTLEQPAGAVYAVDQKKKKEGRESTTNASTSGENRLKQH